MIEQLLEELNRYRMLNGSSPDLIILSEEYLHQLRIELEQNSRDNTEKMSGMFFAGIRILPVKGFGTKLVVKELK